MGPNTAISLIDLGYWVHELRPNCKRPASAHGCKDATRDKSVVSRWPTDCNIGIASGHPFADGQLLVFDADTKQGEQLLRWYGLVPTVVTRKGWHAYTIAPSGMQFSNKVRALSGVDIRTMGGYLLAPGSVVEGHRYAFVGPVQTAPASLLCKVEKQEPLPVVRVEPRYGEPTRKGLGALKKVARDLASVGPGARNQTLFNDTCWLYRLALEGEVSMTDVDGFVTAAASGLGLPQWEIRRTLASARKKVGV